MNKQNLIACIIAFIAGILYLIAAPQYAAACTLKTPKDVNMMAVAFAIPTVAFTVAGCAGVIGSIIGLIASLVPSKPDDE